MKLLGNPVQGLLISLQLALNLIYDESVLEGAEFFEDRDIVGAKPQFISAGSVCQAIAAHDHSASAAGTANEIRFARTTLGSRDI